MLHHLGIGIQLVAMAALLLLVPYQLMFGFKLIVMPTATVIAIVLFSLGTMLREKAAK